jgi:hypothetical protein
MWYTGKMNKYTEAQKSELALFVKAGDCRISYFKRVQSVHMRAQGIRACEVVKICGFSERRIRLYCEQYLEGGLEALLTKH